MKKIFGSYFKKLLLMLILIIIFFILYGFVHEFAHYSACSLLGLKSTISINLLQNPPKYQADCQGINEKGNLGKFFFWSSPYMLSLILIILYLFLWKWKTFYMLSIPLAIVMSDIFNLMGFYEWLFGKGQIMNDIFILAVKIPKFYTLILLAIIGLSITGFILIYIKTIKAESKFPLSKKN